MRGVPSHSGCKDSGGAVRTELGVVDAAVPHKMSAQVVRSGWTAIDPEHLDIAKTE
jgi:hypothetical protein